MRAARGAQAQRAELLLSRSLTAPTPPPPTCAPERPGFAPTGSLPAPKLAGRYAGSAPERKVLRAEGRASMEPGAPPVADLRKEVVAGSWGGGGDGSDPKHGVPWRTHKD